MAGPVRVEGLLRLADRTVCEGDVVAPAGVVLGENVLVEGDVYTDGVVELGVGARIDGEIRPTHHMGDADGPPTPDVPTETASPGTPDETTLEALDTALARARDHAGPGDPGPGEAVEEALDHAAQAYLATPPETPWPRDVVARVLFGRALARAIPLTVDRADADEARLRVLQPEDQRDGTDWSRRVATLVLALGRAVRPGLEVDREPVPAEAPGTARLIVRY